MATLGEMSLRRPPHPTNNQPWHDIVTLGEQRIGADSRCFTFACDIDNKALRAKLRDGVLSIVVRNLYRKWNTILSSEGSSPLIECGAIEIDKGVRIELILGAVQR